MLTEEAVNSQLLLLQWSYIFFVQLLYDFGTIIKESETVTKQSVLHLYSLTLHTLIYTGIGQTSIFSYKLLYLQLSVSKLSKINP